MKAFFLLLIAAATCAYCRAQENVGAQQKSPYAAEGNPRSQVTPQASYPPGSDQKPLPDTSFVDFRERYYIRPRAYPKKEVSEQRRLQAYEQLLRLRSIAAVAHPETTKPACSKSQRDAPTLSESWLAMSSTRFESST